MTLRARPGAGVAALSWLLAEAGAFRHPLLARDAARRGLPGAIRLATARHPDRVALIRDADTVTAGDLAAEAGALAHDLGARGGTRVGVRSDGGIGYVATLAAALAAGLDAVPLGPRLSPADVAGLDLAAVLEPRRAATRAPLPDGSGRVLLLTTGTTGSPVPTTRGPVGRRALAQLADAARRTALPAHGPLLLLAPPDHGHGLSALVGALVRGIPVVLASGRTPEEQHRMALAHRPASVSGVPAQLARLLDAGGYAGAQVVVAGSSPLGPELRARIAATGARVHDGFGTTATGTIAVDGVPLAGVALRIGDDGLEVRSPLGGVRWVATGDRAEFRRGRLRLSGRTGAVVDSGGELVDPGRLQRVLIAHPGVAGVTVTVETDDLLGHVLHAHVDADPALEPALRATIAARLGRAEHPRVLSVSRIPSPASRR